MNTRCCVLLRSRLSGTWCRRWLQHSIRPRPRKLPLLRDRGQPAGKPFQCPRLKGYWLPDRRVATKIALGLRLDEIENFVTRKTSACFEPTLDYCVLKIPRWPFDKFRGADRTLGTQMKATGEVMAIDRTFEGALLKAVRSLPRSRQWASSFLGFRNWRPGNS